RDRIVRLNLVPHRLSPAGRDVEMFFVRRQRDAVRNAAVGVLVAAEQRHLAVLDQIEAVERDLAVRIPLGAAKSPRRVREIDRAVRFDDDVVWTGKLLALVAIGEDGAGAVLLETVNRPVVHRRDDDTSLRIEREAVASDEDDADAAGDGLRAALGVV